MSSLDWCVRIEGTDDYRTIKEVEREGVIIPIGRVFNLSVPWWLTWLQSRHDPRLLEMALWHDEDLRDPDFSRVKASANAFDIARPKVSAQRAWCLFFALLWWTELRDPPETQTQTEKGHGKMFAFIQRRRQLLVDQERVTHLVSLKKKTQGSLSEQDFLNFARAIDVPPAHFHGLCNRESSGSGFDEHGRLKILYERHRVSENTKRVLDKRLFPWQYRGRSIQVHLSTRKYIRPNRDRMDIWHPYYEGPQGQWEMLATTYELHPGAIRGASYGAFQVLGQNAESLGYRSALHMIEEMYDGGEYAQIEVAIRYLKRNNVIEPLRRGDWLEVEKRWNGRAANGEFAHGLEKEVTRLRGSVYA